MPIVIAALTAVFLGLAIADVAIAAKEGIPGRRRGGGTRNTETVWPSPAIAPLEHDQ